MQNWFYPCLDKSVISPSDWQWKLKHDALEISPPWCQKGHRWLAETPARFLVYTLFRHAAGAKVQFQQEAKAFFMMTVSTRLIFLRYAEVLFGSSIMHGVSTRDTRNFYWKHGGCWEWSFPPTFHWVSKEKPESPQWRSLKTHSGRFDLPCWILPLWLFNYLLLCALHISISRIGIHACARVHVCVVGPLGESFGELIVFTCGANCNPV